MNPITNSPIKEGFRLHYYNIADNRKNQIENTFNSDCISVNNDATNRMNSITYKNKPDSVIFWVLAIAGGIVFAFMAGFTGFIIGALIGSTAYGALVYKVKQDNEALDASKRQIRSEADRKIQELRNNADRQIRATYNEADARTQQDINQYDDAVKRNCQNMLKRPDAFSAMVDHAVNMFQRMVSHADSASNKKFVETNFTYKVELYGICYKYQSTYSNPKDDFNFDRERFRNLTTREECEGLAQAMAKMIMAKMKKLYPPNSLNITVSHIDAEVTMHFKAANKNYVPPRDIY